VWWTVVAVSVGLAALWGIFALADVPDRQPAPAPLDLSAWPVKDWDLGTRIQPPADGDEPYGRHALRAVSLRQRAGFAAGPGHPEPCRGQRRHSKGAA
jgi:hypothetical protein